MTIVRNYLRFFKEQGRLTLPLNLVRVPKAFGNSHYSIPEDEYRSMVNAIAGSSPRTVRDRLIIRMLHDTGMRVGELCSLDLDDLHDDMSATIRTEKTVRSRRVFWNPDTEQDLQNYLVHRIKQSTESDAVFLPELRPASARLTRRAVQRVVKVVVQRARVNSRISPHSFRHAFIHRVAKLGVPDAIIAVLVGHTTPHTIAHYTKLSRPEYEEAFKQSLSGCASPFGQILATAA
jgi:integrase/recombinase XerD